MTISIIYLCMGQNTFYTKYRALTSNGSNTNYSLYNGTILCQQQCCFIIIVLQNVCLNISSHIWFLQVLAQHSYTYMHKCIIVGTFVVRSTARQYHLTQYIHMYHNKYIEGLVPNYCNYLILYKKLQ